MALMKKLRIGLLILVSLLCLAGCKKEDPGPIAAGIQTGTENLYINDFILLQFENSETESWQRTLFYDTYGSKLYLLQACSEGESVTGQLSLYVFDGDTKERPSSPSPCRFRTGKTAL